MPEAADTLASNMAGNRSKNQRKNTKKRLQKQRLRESKKAELTHKIKMQLAGFNLQYHNPAHHPELPYDDVPAPPTTSNLTSKKVKGTGMPTPAMVSGDSTTSQKAAKKRKHESQPQDDSTKKRKAAAIISDLEAPISNTILVSPLPPAPIHQQRSLLEARRAPVTHSPLPSIINPEQVLSNHPCPPPAPHSTLPKKPDFVTPSSSVDLPPTPLAVLHSSNLTPRFTPQASDVTSTITYATPSNSTTVAAKTTADIPAKPISAVMFELRVKELKLIMSQIERAKTPEERKVLTARWKTKNKELSTLSVTAPTPVTRTPAGTSGLTQVALTKEAPPTFTSSLFLRKPRFLDIPFFSSLIIEISDTEDEDECDDDLADVVDW